MSAYSSTGENVCVAVCVAGCCNVLHLKSDQRKTHHTLQHPATHTATHTFRQDLLHLKSDKLILPSPSTSAVSISTGVFCLSAHVPNLVNPECIAPPQTCNTARLPKQPKKKNGRTRIEFRLCCFGSLPVLQFSGLQ